MLGSRLALVCPPVWACGPRWIDDPKEETPSRAMGKGCGGLDLLPLRIAFPREHRACIVECISAASGNLDSGAY